MIIPNVGASTRVCLQSWMGTFVCAENGGGSIVVANRPVAGEWETFEIRRLDADHITLRASNRQFLCAERGGGTVVRANRNEVSDWETFTLFVDQNGLISLAAHDGSYICAEPSGIVMANRQSAGEWEAFRIVDPENANGDQTRIEVNVYKLGVTRVTPDGIEPIWHTGTVIGREWYFNDTERVIDCDPGGGPGAHHRTMIRLIPGNMERAITIRESVIARWNGTRYNVSNHNCNFFTDDLLQSLSAPGLDQEYLDASGVAKGLREIPGGATVQELVVKWPLADKRLDQAFMEDLRRLAHLPADVRDELGRIGGQIGDVINNIPLPNWPRPW